MADTGSASGNHLNDCVTGSSSSLSSACPSETDSSSSCVVSLLDWLKVPTLAAITRKRQTKSNPPPVGKCQCRGSSSSDPKKIEPSTCVKEFPNELLKVSVGKLFCSACWEEIGLICFKRGGWTYLPGDNREAPLSHF